MYLAQVPKTPGVHLVAIADLVACRGARQPRARRLARRAQRRAFDRRALAQRHDARRRRLAGAGRASGDRHRRRMHRQPDRGGRALPRRRSPSGKHVVNVTVEADALCGAAARAQGGRGRRRLQPRLRRPAGADLRSRRLGAHRRLRRRRRGPRPQVAAALRAVDAGDRLGPLRPHARAGEDRRPQRRRCSTRFSTARSRRSSARPCATRPACRRRRTA